VNRKFCQQKYGFCPVLGIGKEFDHIGSSERKERDEEKKDKQKSGLTTLNLRFASFLAMTQSDNN